MAAPVPDTVFDDNYRAQYARLAGVKLTRIPDSAHFIMLDAPARFQTEAKAFLSDQSNSRR